MTNRAHLPEPYRSRTHRVRRSILNLEQLSDIALYEALSEGTPLIVDNATNLDETARRLYRDEEYRASEVMRGFAEEEAAKVLILIDYVRCPRSWKQRSQVLKRFYGHVAKRIHAMACDFPRIASFKELSNLVESECRPWYLERTERHRLDFCELDFGETRTRPLCRLCAGRDRRRGRVPLDRSCSSHPFSFRNISRRTASRWFDPSWRRVPFRPAASLKSPMSGGASCPCRTPTAGS